MLKLKFSRFSHEDCKYPANDYCTTISPHPSARASVSGLVTTSRPGFGVMFKQTLDVLPQILVVFPKIEPLRSKVWFLAFALMLCLVGHLLTCIGEPLDAFVQSVEIRELLSLIEGIDVIEGEDLKILEKKLS